MTSNGKQFTVTREMLTAVAGISARYSKFAFVLFCYITNHLMTGPLGNIEILGKQNSLFPPGPVIKCLLTNVKTFLLTFKRDSKTTNVKSGSGHVVPSRLAFAVNVDLKLKTLILQAFLEGGGGHIPRPPKRSRLFRPHI